MVFEGQGGVAGFAKGEAAVNLTSEGEASTRLSYIVKAMVGGKLAQLGARLIDGVARKLSNEFFTKFNAAMSGGKEKEAANAEPTPNPTSKPEGTFMLKIWGRTNSINVQKVPGAAANWASSTNASTQACNSA